MSPSFSLGSTSEINGLRIENVISSQEFDFSEKALKKRAYHFGVPKARDINLVQRKL
jgi:hypothetical protein